ncbi:MAG: NAD(P)-binding protein [Gemmatimonadetes bacterium]|jgi:menaquinone-9 beta-reductase|nr:NAD(P)-binding protein [Gemmatimonadota bacterium]MBT5056503.1 NAD(P)-binding protein [Gemmatimonadota bacterium]MBT5142481.1 NAD(P)-binding protein [Gemmatimonadota bacterium]MBT5586411.1 NAD(P)-binding protein [Gemmatimonadota bacterium]MBT5961222.1 NAD(P)-binding protein [Gemmatimonadota bacterium]
MTSTRQTEILVVGAGPAGLATGLALSRQGRRVMVAEKARIRRRKLCGEFLSGDGWRVLEDLGLSTRLMRAGVHAVGAAVICPDTGNHWRQTVGGLGVGCSRSLLTAELERSFFASGGRILRGCRVGAVEGGSGRVMVHAREGTEATRIEAAVAVAAGGHRSQARVPMQSQPVHRRNPWFALAVHCTCDEVQHLPDAVELYPLSHGYAGLVQIEGDRANLCLMSDRPISNPMRYIGEIRGSNRHLDNRLRVLSLDSSSLAMSAGFDFRAQDPGFLAVGDAAGPPAPVLGQGLAMALQSGLLAAQLIDEGLQNRLPVEQIHQQMRQLASTKFGRRRRLGSGLHYLLRHPMLTRMVVAGMNCAPGLSHWLVRQTRGPLPAQLGECPQVASATA